MHFPKTTTPTLFLKNSKTSKGSTSETGSQLLKFIDKNNNILCDVESIVTSTGSCELRLRSNTLDSNNQNVQTGVTLISSANGGKNFCPTSNNNVFLGASTLKWSRVYSTQYYYGNDNVEFSTKFVTTDTAQTISGVKTFSEIVTAKINGLTPSSLSLPSNTGYIDISSYFTNTGDGQTNSYTASANGWIYLNVVAKSLIMQIRDSNDNVVYADMCNRSSDGTIYMTIPIGSGNKLLTQWFTSSSVTVTTARFIPCQGNV